MIKGYPKWKKLPQNKEELWGALYDVGLNPPQSVREELEKSENSEEIRKIFAHKVCGHGSAELSNLLSVQAMLTPEGREVFWHETLPALYSDIIEMLGDKYGRERFGLGKNERAGFRESKVSVEIEAPAAESLKPKTQNIN